MQEQDIAPHLLTFEICQYEVGYFSKVNVANTLRQIANGIVSPQGYNLASTLSLLRYFVRTLASQSESPAEWNTSTSLLRTYGVLQLACGTGTIHHHIAKRQIRNFVTPLHKLRVRSAGSQHGDPEDQTGGPEGTAQKGS